MKDLETIALRLAMEHYLTSTHEDRNHEAILEALRNGDLVLLKELEVYIGGPFENCSLWSIAVCIVDEFNTNLKTLGLL